MVIAEPSRTRGASATQGNGGSKVAWLATLLGCLYCALLGLVHLRSAVEFGTMFAGLGAELPASTRFLVKHGSWLHPVVFGSVVGVLLLKEVIVTDKRLTAILTCLLVLVAQFLAHWMATLYYLPLFDLARKLS